MAIRNERRGWEWTPAERDHRKLALRQVIKIANRIREQIRRTNLILPQFSNAASEASEPLLKAVNKLSGIDLRNRGRKYQPLSPDEVDCIFQAVPDLLQVWDQFTSSQEYASAVRVSNTEIRKRNAEIRKRNRAASEEASNIYREMKGVLQRLDEGDIAGALDEAAQHGLL